MVDETEEQPQKYHDTEDGPSASHACTHTHTHTRAHTHVHTHTDNVADCDFKKM